MSINWFNESIGTALFLLLLAFILTGIIGLERQYRLKAAGFRTHALVGIGAALFTLISAHGFANLPNGVAPGDPARIAAQIVSGIGFLGAGVIFVRHDSVSGLTTAASIWITASVGMACGANLPVLAIATTLLYLIAVGPAGYVTRVFRSVHRSDKLVVCYREGQDALKVTQALLDGKGYKPVVTGTRTVHELEDDQYYEASILLTSPRNVHAEPLLDEIAEIPGVTSAWLAGPELE